MTCTTPSVRPVVALLLLPAARLLPLPQLWVHRQPLPALPNPTQPVRSKPFPNPTHYIRS